MTIEERYEWACKDADIGVLIPVLRKYGEQCRHITEFGVRNGCSTSAWLSARPNWLVCYDVGLYDSVSEIRNLAMDSGIDFQFHQQNTAEAVIEATDLLFIDTVHNANQLAFELAFNNAKVNKFIILHDTDTYGITGEGGARGMWYCLHSFLLAHFWRILEVRPESNGLTVLQRICR